MSARHAERDHQRAARHRGAIALGNTLEALVGAWLLRCLVGFDKAMEHVQDVLGLAVLAAAGPRSTEE